MIRPFARPLNEKFSPGIYTNPEYIHHITPQFPIYQAKMAKNLLDITTNNLFLALQDCFISISTKSCG